MKKHFLVLALSLLIILTSLFVACQSDNLNDSIFPSDNSPSSNSAGASQAAAIRELENLIADLKQSQYASGVEYQTQIKNLEAKLEALRAESEKADSESDTSTPNTTPSASPSSRFLYQVVDGKAIVTGYTGDVTTLVIPSSIDGYPVDQIAERAFASERLHTVIVTGGITRIDWFAFQDCPKLTAITIPSSVISIGYEAFPSVSSLTIYCHNNSFALSYAKSYGIAYAII